MPFVRISHRRGKPSEYGAAIGDAVHRAMVEALGIPEDDRFQVITEHPQKALSTTLAISASIAPTALSSSKSP